LANSIRACRSCEWTKSEPMEDYGLDDDECDPDDSDVVMSVLCHRCAEELERRYSRPARALGVRTLADVLAEAYGQQILYWNELMDFDIREVLPTLSDEFRPAQRRWERYARPLGDVLRRVGKDVCLMDPAGVELNEADGRVYARE